MFRNDGVSDILDNGWWQGIPTSPIGSCEWSEPSPVGFRLENGDGRFATPHRKELMVVTKTKNGPRSISNSMGRLRGLCDVSDIEIKVIERARSFFGPSESGTRLAMVGAPDPWSNRMCSSASQAIADGLSIHASRASMCLELSGIPRIRTPNTGEGHRQLSLRVEGQLSR